MTIENKEFQEVNDIKMEGYCKIEKEIKTFVPTESPKGFFVCSSCRSKTDKLESPPEKMDYSKII